MTHKKLPASLSLCVSVREIAACRWARTRSMRACAGGAGLPARCSTDKTKVTSSTQHFVLDESNRNTLSFHPPYSGVGKVGVCVLKQGGRGRRRLWWVSEVTDVLCNPACISPSSSWIIPVSGLQHIFHLLHCKYTHVNDPVCFSMRGLCVCVSGFSVAASALHFY